MKVVVDLTRCEGYGQCAFLAPDVFRMRSDEALTYEAEPDDAQREAILRAEAACPVQAIKADGFARAGAAATSAAAAAAASAGARGVFAGAAAVPAQRTSRRGITGHGRGVPAQRPHRDRGRVAGRAAGGGGPAR